MIRQCAWCLRLMNNDGEHLSPAPLPKIYEATHGICGVCGMRWMEQAMGTQDTSEIFLQLRTQMVDNTSAMLTEPKTPATIH